MSNHRQDNPTRRDARRPKVTPKLCDGVPISGASNLNKLLKGQRQGRMRARGYRVPHNRAGWRAWAKGDGFKVLP